MISRSKGVVHWNGKVVRLTSFRAVPWPSQRSAQAFSYTAWQPWLSHRSDNHCTQWDSRDCHFCLTTQAGKLYNWQPGHSIETVGDSHKHFKSDDLSVSVYREKNTRLHLANLLLNNRISTVISNFIHLQQWDVTTHPWAIFNGCLIKLPFVFGMNRFYIRQKLLHDKSSMSKLKYREVSWNRHNISWQ